MANGFKTGGRTKGTPNKATEDIRGIAREYTADAIKALVDIVRNVDHPARVHAAREILDRGFGKARQMVELDGEVTVRSITVEFVDTK